jgi:outer membrane putative beta-barrel porin/alpha-amylase
MHRQRAVLVALMLMLTAPVSAQETVRGVVTFLLTNQAVQTADFQRDRAAADAVADAITQALLINLTSVPIETSSSGFLYRLNSTLGVVERATPSFGAVFVERALTPGNGRASIGVSGSTTSFDRLDGLSLRDGSLVTVANKFRDETAPFNTESLTLHIRTSRMTLFGSVGIGDRFELGAAVPFVRLTLDGDRVNDYRGSSIVQARGSATVSGIADMAVRAKYTVFSTPNGGIAAAAELRLPTGNEDNLLGAGKVSWRIFGVASADRGAWGMHANVGIVRGGLSDETTFNGAVSIAAHPKLTISGELLGRQLSELRDLTVLSTPHPTIVGVDTLRLATGLTGNTLLNAVVSAKWNVSGTLVISGYLAWPLVDHGLTGPVTPTIGLEYAF